MQQQCTRSARLHVGVRFGPSPATCDASAPRVGDCLSTGVCSLRLFLLAAHGGAGSSGAPVFASRWKQPQATGVAPSSLPRSMLSPLGELHWTVRSAANWKRPQVAGIAPSSLPSSLSPLWELH